MDDGMREAFKPHPREPASGGKVEFQSPLASARRLGKAG